MIGRRLHSLRTARVNVHQVGAAKAPSYAMSAFPSRVVETGLTYFGQLTFG